MTASPSRGLLYPTLPEYDVFESRPEATADGTETPEETGSEGTQTPAQPGESSAPVMARANWTGTVSADD